MSQPYIRVWLLLPWLAAGCGGLLPKPTPPADVYALEDLPAPAVPEVTRGPPPATPRPTLVVALPVADPGSDSAHMVYLESPGRPAHFAHSDWVDAPARLLLPLIVRRLGADPAFRAVIAAPSAAAADLRLETELVRLQQEFAAGPSRVRLTLRAYLVRETTREVVATQSFEALVAADSESPAGGARAAGRAVGLVLGQLAAFTVAAASP